MTSWKIIYTNEAKNNIENAVEYYNLKSVNLGKRFYNKIKVANSKLRISPYFQVRYNSVRCLPLEVFPFMLHFEIEEEKGLVKVYAVLCTLMNPDKAWVF